MKPKHPRVRAVAAYRDYRSRLARRLRPDLYTLAGVGHVVEFLKGGQCMCGVLLRKGRVCRILDVRGKENDVAPEKLADISSAFVATHLPRHERLKALQRVDEVRNGLKEDIDLYELWDVVRPEGDRWELEELAELYFADEPGPHGTAALFRALEDGNAFRRDGTSFVPLSPERVAEHRERQRRVRQREAWMNRAAKWLRGLCDGKPVPSPPNADRALELLASKVLFGSDHPAAAEANALAHMAHFHSRKAIFQTLVKAGYWAEEENLDLLRHEVPVAFSPGTLSEASSSEWTQKAKGARRVWFGKVYALSGLGSLHERAVGVRRCISGFVVRVHFSSPALVVRREGLVQSSAGDRAATLHLPDRLVPMLPLPIFERAALVAGERRPSLTVTLHFGSDWELKRYGFELRRVRVNRRAPAREASRRLATDRRLRWLHKLAQHLRQSRIDAGAVVVTEPDVQVRAADGEVMLQRQEPLNPVGLINRELSILVNTLAGRFFLRHGLPAIYRTEERCRKVLVEPDVFDPVLCYRQKQLMPRAMLRTNPAPHHGLGVEVYAPISRPFDRYSDLLMHQQIVEFLQKGSPAYPEKALAQACLYTLAARRDARRVEGSSRRYWLLRYLESQVGHELEAVVLGRRGSGYSVELTETRLWTYCPSLPGPALEPGQHVRLRVLSVSPRAGEVYLGPS